MSRNKELRIVLIGCTGVGKSSVGNTLLGKKQFEESAAANSVTSKCEVGECTVGTRHITVVDTPGLISSDGNSMMSILGNFLKVLAPGPHAIIIVIEPKRDSTIARKALEDLQIFFRDDHFLNFTMIVMVRKSDIIGDYGECDNIQEFISQKSSENVKKLYINCKERLVAIENKQSMNERKKEAEHVFEVIDNMDGYYDHEYFRIISESKVKDKELKVKDKELKVKDNVLKEQDKEIAELKEQVLQLGLEKNKKKWFYFF